MTPLTDVEMAAIEDDLSDASESLARATELLLSIGRRVEAEVVTRAKARSTV